MAGDRRTFRTQPALDDEDDDPEDDELENDHTDDPNPEEGE